VSDTCKKVTNVYIDEIESTILDFPTCKRHLTCRVNLSKIYVTSQLIPEQAHINRKQGIDASFKLVSKRK